MPSTLIKDTCCGTTCDKNEIVNKVAALEAEIIELELKITEYEKQREEFARKCFMAGLNVTPPYNTNHVWLNFKATEL